MIILQSILNVQKRLTIPEDKFGSPLILSPIQTDLQFPEVAFFGLRKVACVHNDYQSEAFLQNCPSDWQFNHHFLYLKS